MRDWLDAHKPSASARWHLLLAALMWTVVGGLLLFFGVRWVLGQPGAHAWLLLLVAMTAGLLKARFVLQRTAGRMIERTRTRGDGRCLGGFLVRWWWRERSSTDVDSRRHESGPPRRRPARGSRKAHEEA